MSERTGQHSALDARDDLLAIADTWPDLLARLGKEGSSAQDGMPRPVSRTPGLVINEQVSQVMADIRDWCMFLARQLLDESDWTPPRGLDTPGMLAHIARTRIGFFTEHPDEGLRLGFGDDAREMRHLAERTAYPSGRRMIPLDIVCMEHDTSPAGERVKCLGEYGVLLDPDRPGLIPDMVCSLDRTHRITPAEWQRASRRTAMDPSAMAALLARIRGAA